MELPFYVFFFFTLGDLKTQPLSAILKLCSFGYLWPPSPSSLPFVGIICTCVLFLASLQPFIHIWQWSIFCVCVFCTHYKTWDGQLPCVPFELTVLWLFPYWWMTKGFCMFVTKFLWETGSDWKTQYSSFILRLNENWIANFTLFDSIWLIVRGANNFGTYGFQKITGNIHSLSAL